MTSRKHPAQLTTAALASIVSTMSASQIRELLFAAFEELEDHHRQQIVEHAIDMTSRRRRKLRSHVTRDIVAALSQAGYSDAQIGGLTDLAPSRIRSMLGTAEPQLSDPEPT